MPSRAQINAIVSDTFKGAARCAPLWEMLKKGDPVPIAALYRAIHPNPNPAETTPMMQKYVGANLARINKTLALYDLRIGPGAPRQTYVLGPLPL